MRPDVPAVKLTYDDLLLLPEDRNRHELIDGEHYATAAPSFRHQTAVGNLLRLLGNFLQGRALGRVWTSPIDVVLSGHDVVEPDLIFVSQANLERVKGRHLEGAPDLVVEVLSGSTRSRDETAKRRLYEKHGVREYWLVDPDAETVSVLQQAGLGYPPPAEVFAAGNSLATPLLPGLEIPVTAIFE